MRGETTRRKVEALMDALGKSVRGPGRIYLTGGATAVWFGWRESTMDVDLKPDPEPTGFFEALAPLKEELDINLELASPEQFIPALPDWRERSLFIVRRGLIDFFHYDPYAQALSKLQRRHERDLTDVTALWQHGFVQKPRLRELFFQIRPQLIRYPAIDPAQFERAVTSFCDATA